jgi:hypothetical protein
MLYYFNPGHETAILNSSRYYQPPRRIAKMQADLADLPKWYAKGKVDLWAVSPAAIAYLEKLNTKQGLNLQIPVWKDEFRYLSSRRAASDVLSKIIESIPEIDSEILPCWFSSIEEIVKFVNFRDLPNIVKSPFSSSGRGLLWITGQKTGQSERQIIAGMLQRQGQVSLEKALDKCLDFSMHFDLKKDSGAEFIGYSVFYTNQKGGYEKSVLASQDIQQRLITEFIEKSLIEKVQKKITNLLNEIYLPYYEGNIGVDMLIYRSETDHKLQPCVEINMRKTMGYVALQLFKNHIDKYSQGEFVVDYFKDPVELLGRHREMQKKYPLKMAKHRICSGYLSLCPVTESTNYRAYVTVGRSLSAL